MFWRYKIKTSKISVVRRAKRTHNTRLLFQSLLTKPKPKVQTFSFSTTRSLSTENKAHRQTHTHWDLRFEIRTQTVIRSTPVEIINNGRKTSRIPVWVRADIINERKSESKHIRNQQHSWWSSPLKTVLLGTVDCCSSQWSYPRGSSSPPIQGFSSLSFSFSFSLFLILIAMFGSQEKKKSWERNYNSRWFMFSHCRLFVFLRFLDSPHPKRSRVRIISILPLFFPSRLIEESIL